MLPISRDTLPEPITLYRASQMLTADLEAGVRHEPGLLGQMLAHLMANAARGDEVARTALECLGSELKVVLGPLQQAHQEGTESARP